MATTQCEAQLPCTEHQLFTRSAQIHDQHSAVQTHQQDRATANRRFNGAVHSPSPIYGVGTCVHIQHKFEMVFSTYGAGEKVDMGHTEQTLLQRNGYVLVERPRGYSVILSNQASDLREISASCQQSGCRKVLVVGQDTNVALSPADVFSLGERIAKLGLQFAVVETHDAAVEDVSFLENVATNRGGPIQFFDDTDAAKEWLKVD